MKYIVIRRNQDINSLFKNSSISNITPLRIDKYLWTNNNYMPKVEVRLCYSISHLFVFFNSFEKEITARYTQINDPVHKDSCVEFFINLFPKYHNEYFNFELNAIGTLYAGFGTNNNRCKLPIEDIEKTKIESSLTEPFIGKITEEQWSIKLAVPFDLFETYYSKKFMRDDAKSNFYKCGDETKFEHYGCWNKINSKSPNFHLLEYFGDLKFH